MSLNPFQPDSFDGRRRESQKLMMMISSLTLVAAALAGSPGDTTATASQPQITDHIQSGKTIALTSASGDETKVAGSNAQRALPISEAAEKTRDKNSDLADPS
ncbi:hypothetical protein [Glutamicibacter ardleyensis]|uniref:hypothetical protein n=1 Tax=Glutamicibacter ardleyensis TaxID=225894 RepID=UPI003FB65620